jgi:hypothetical protein
MGSGDKEDLPAAKEKGTRSDKGWIIALSSLLVLCVVFIAVRSMSMRLQKSPAATGTYTSTPSSAAISP